MFSVLRVEMCSNRWAKPERPCGSFFEPTSYHIEVVTLAVVGSGSAITVRPLASFHSVNAIAGAVTAAGACCAASGGAATVASAAPASRMGRSMESPSITNTVSSATGSSAAILPAPGLIDQEVIRLGDGREGDTRLTDLTVSWG